MTLALILILTAGCRFVSGEDVATGVPVQSTGGSPSPSGGITEDSAEAIALQRSESSSVPVVVFTQAGPWRELRAETGETLFEHDGWVWIVTLRGTLQPRGCPVQPAGQSPYPCSSYPGTEQVVLDFDTGELLFIHYSGGSS